MSSILQKIREMEKGNGNVWKPETEGDLIAGVAVSDLRTVDTKFGPRVVIDVRSVEDGKIYTIWASTVIENELNRQAVRVGDEVGIKFLGQKKNYKDFVVHVEKKNTEPMKEALLDEQSPDPDKKLLPVDPAEEAEG